MLDMHISMRQRDSVPCVKCVFLCLRKVYSSSSSPFLSIASASEMSFSVSDTVDNKNNNNLAMVKYWLQLSVRIGAINAASFCGTDLPNSRRSL